MPEPAIRARDVSVQYRIRRHDGSRTLRSTLVNSLLPWRGARRNRRQTFWALKDINLAAHPGEIIGIIGPNGSGKTTLLRTLAGIIGADRGEVAVRGRVACLMGFGVGFNPDLTGRENIVLSGSLIGIARNRIDEIVEDVIELSELSDFISAPVRTYSRGMRVRLGFAIASHLRPEVLLLDEVLAAGDEAFRKKAGSILDNVRGDRQSVILASHSIPLVRKTCSRVVWLDRGEVRMDDAPQPVCDAYLEQVRLDQARIGPETLSE